MVTDKRIGVLMGGTSAEREVSLKSGNAVLNALKGRNYNVAAIDVEHDICEVIKRQGVEVAFLTLHGGYGEDGSLQGLLDVLGIPYTGSGVLASALAMDKESSKKVFLYHRIPVPSFKVIHLERSVSGEKPESPHYELPAVDFSLPWVIKPAAEGSSIGVSIVKEHSSLRAAMGHAAGFGTRIIVEKYIQGKEIQVGILNNRILGAVEVRPTLEFYNYEAKYTAGLTDYILPPEVDQGILRNAEKAALSAHTALGCRGATRVDLIVDKEGNPYVLEVNTIPGMTETSLLPKIAARAGLDFPSLIEEILKGALAGRKGT
ncbi:MAG TPA: D-alanine--D-alanine ligase [Thermodesulfovibrionales bacterium]|nr:D-alanine--D-alanine ligase [Thermodesulfovibrionales bacterium]